MAGVDNGAINKAAPTMTDAENNSLPVPPVTEGRNGKDQPSTTDDIDKRTIDMALNRFMVYIFVATGVIA